MAPKVFAIGTKQDGTSSLHEAFGVLGLRSLHFAPEDEEPAPGTAPPGHFWTVIAERIRDRHPDPLGEWGDYDAYSDIGPITDGFEHVYRCYPGSRFIYTDRDDEDWLASREAHVLRNREAHREGRERGDWLTVDRERWLAQKHDHLRRVREWFSVEGRTRDLLEFNVFRGDGYAELCGFLGLPVPDEPYPWRNRTTGDRPD